MAFTLELEMRTGEVITDLALLIHASNGERVALVDLRSPSGPYRLQAGETLALRCDIADLPFVESDFNVGLYINADSVCQSFMNLLTLTVVPSESVGSVVPRDPQVRGLVELRHKVRHTVVRRAVPTRAAGA
jgi:hypothetical protein